MHAKILASKILASTLTTLLALPALIGGGLVLTPATAEAAVTSATCQIHAIEAKLEGDGKIPAELDFIADQLRQLQYKSYRLLDAKDFKLELGKTVDQKFKSGHNVKLSLVGDKDGKLELRTELLRGELSLLNVEFSLKNNQAILMPVTRGDETVIFAYQCKG